MSRALGSKYTLGESIGRGAMGEAFKGHDLHGNELAFKLLHAELARDPQLVERFVKERSILLALRGENLVEVRDLVIEGDTLAIVMDLVTGGDLRAALKAHGPFAPAEVCRIGAGIARGLQVVHETGIIHRDIKPANILLGGPAAEPVPKLSDFGISSLIDEAHMRSTTVVGTPQYIAPEVAAGRSAVPASDLYALGIVLYELAVGVTPFAGGSVMAVLLRHGTTLAARPEGIPDPLWELISDLLAKDPAARPADAHTTARALEALTLQLAGIPAAPRLASPLAPQPLSDVTPTDAVALPAASGSPALALPPMPPPAPEPVPETSLQPTGVLPPGPGLKAAYASISEPGESRYQSSDPTQAHGSESLSDAQPPAPAVVSGGGPPSYSMPSASGDAGTRTTLFIVVGAVLALVLTGAGVLFWYLNGSRVDPSPLQPEAVKTSAPAPSPESQSPEPPGVVPAGTTPDLKGKTEAQARALIPENVNVTVTQEMTLDFSAGEINAQEPAAGQPLGDSLKLTVESGFTDEIPEPVWLPKPAQGSWLNIGTATLHGVTHDTVIGAEVCLPGGPTTGTVVYDLAGKFSRFTATVDLVNGAGDSGDSASIEVLVDGKVYDSATLDKNSFREWDIDLTGAKKLEFNWSREHCMLDGTKVGLGSPVFTRATQ